MRTPDFPAPEDFSEKEVYAYFGVAAFFAQVFEKGLVNMIVLHKTSGLSITEAEFDQVYAPHDSQTIERLLKSAAKQGIPIPDETLMLLEEAQRRRNYLNHDFFADHAGHWETVETRKVMIDRLCTLIRVFRAADRAAEKIYGPLMQKMGVTDESLAAHTRAIVERAKKEQATNPTDETPLGQ